MSVNSVINEVKKSTNRLEKDIGDAKRLVRLMEDMGRPVPEQKVKIKQMEGQLKKMQYAIKQDAQRQEEQYVNKMYTIKEYCKVLGGEPSAVLDILSEFETPFTIASNPFHVQFILSFTAPTIQSKALRRAPPAVLKIPSTTFIIILPTFIKSVQIWSNRLILSQHS